jgi:hypothetical protein
VDKKGTATAVPICRSSVRTDQTTKVQAHDLANQQNGSATSDANWDSAWVDQGVDGLRTRTVCSLRSATRETYGRKHRRHKRQGDKQDRNNALQHVASFELLFDLWPVAPQHSRIMRWSFQLLR